MIGAKPVRRNAPQTSVAWRIYFVLLTSSFLDLNGKAIFINKWIRWSSHSKLRSTNSQ